MSYSVNPSVFKSIFAVPTEIVDNHIRLANEHQLKVLLWILRNSTDNPDIDKMCAALKIEKSDAFDYLQYWVLMGVLSGNDDTYAVKPTAEKAEVKPEVEKTAKAAPAKKITADETTPPPPRPSSAEILTRLEESPEIGHLFNEAQVKLGKTIGYDGQCTLLLIHDHYGLPVEVIFMMIDYCVSVGKSNYGYLQTVGKDWGQREIDTIEKAAEQIAVLRASNSFWKEYAIAVGLPSTRPTPKQLEIVRHWREDLKYDLEMIMLAYESMMDIKGQYNLIYLCKILDSWFEKGIKTPDDVAKDAKEFRESKNKKKKTESTTEASYDLDEFKKKSLNNELKYEKRKKKKNELQ